MWHRWRERSVSTGVVATEKPAVFARAVYRRGMPVYKVGDYATRLDEEQVGIIQEVGESVLWCDPLYLLKFEDGSLDWAEDDDLRPAPS